MIAVIAIIGVFVLVFTGWLADNRTGVTDAVEYSALTLGVLLLLWAGLEMVRFQSLSDVLKSDREGIPAVLQTLEHQKGRSFPSRPGKAGLEITSLRGATLTHVVTATPWQNIDALGIGEPVTLYGVSSSSAGRVIVGRDGTVALLGVGRAVPFDHPVPDPDPIAGSVRLRKFPLFRLIFYGLAPLGLGSIWFGAAHVWPVFALWLAAFGWYTVRLPLVLVEVSADGWRVRNPVRNYRVSWAVASRLVDEFEAMNEGGQGQTLLYLERWGARRIKLHATAERLLTPAAQTIIRTAVSHGLAVDIAENRKQVSGS